MSVIPSSNSPKYTSIFMWFKYVFEDFCGIFFIKHEVSSIYSLFVGPLKSFVYNIIYTQKLFIVNFNNFRLQKTIHNWYTLQDIQNGKHWGNHPNSATFAPYVHHNSIHKILRFQCTLSSVILYKRRKDCRFGESEFFSRAIFWVCSCSLSRRKTEHHLIMFLISSIPESLYI